MRGQPTRAVLAEVMGRCQQFEMAEAQRHFALQSVEHGRRIAEARASLPKQHACPDYKERHQLVELMGRNG